MNDEIKEILWIIKSCKQDYDKQKDGMHTFDYGELYLLFNYITNLQKTNKNHSKKLIELGNKITNLQQENEYLKKQNDEKTKIGVADHKYASQMEDKVILLQQENERLKKDYAKIVNDNCDYLKLEQENERLKEENNNKAMNDYAHAIDESWYRELYDDYKYRCEKAIEYNNQIIKDIKDFYRPTTDIIYSGDCIIEIATNNINILQNGSEKE